MLRYKRHTKEAEKDDHEKGKKDEDENEHSQGDTTRPAVCVCVSGGGSRECIARRASLPYPAVKAVYRCTININWCHLGCSGSMELSDVCNSSRCRAQLRDSMVLLGAARLRRPQCRNLDLDTSARYYSSDRGSSSRNV